MKIIKKEHNNEQLNIINSLSSSCNILPKIAEILFDRGYDTVDKINRFLNPSKKNFYSPFDFEGVSEGIQRITNAKNNNEVVVVYGDYDADGICATTLLINALKEFGINAYSVIPEREDGYGLSNQMIDKIASEYFPDLVITVDCGISSKNEVEYLKDLGIDVIVTDHHEIPSDMPDCTVINCKRGYKFDSLCGAGVAYKLAYALIGERADKYLDLVALATIADSMPLVDENRDLVYEGLNLIKSNKNSRINLLFSLCGAKELSANSLAFTVAPRVNAAGRMGNANLALEYFICEDYDSCVKYAEKLISYNVERQVECEKVYNEAKEQLKIKGNYDKIIVLKNKDWKNGLLGIVCARICEEFSKPTILFSENCGVLHGSARSFGDINILEAISNCSDLLIEFGGHSQAAGITINDVNVDSFAIKINQFISNRYDDSIFEKSIEIDGIISEKCTPKFVKSLQKFEPCGIGNKKPLFLSTINNVRAFPIKENSPHLSFSSEFLDFIYFNGINRLDDLNLDITKSVIFELNCSTFNGRDYVKGNVKNLLIDGDFGEKTKLLCLRNYFKNCLTVGASNYQILSNEEMQNLINSISVNDTDTAIVVNNIENLFKFKKLLNFDINLFSKNNKNNKNTLIISPKKDSLSSFKQVIFVDKPLKISSVDNAKTYINTQLNSYSLSGLTCDREVMVSVFKIIKNGIRLMKSSAENIYYDSSKNVSVMQFAFAYEVFSELGIINDCEYPKINEGVKSELEKSKIYLCVKNLLEKSV